MCLRWQISLSPTHEARVLITEICAFGSDASSALGSLYQQKDAAIIIVVVMSSLIWAIFTISVSLKQNPSELFRFCHRCFDRLTDAFLLPCLESLGKTQYMVVIDDSRELDWPTVFPCHYPKVIAQTNGTTGRTQKSAVAKRQEDKWRNHVNTRKQFGGELSGVSEIVTGVLMAKLKLSLLLSQSWRSPEWKDESNIMGSDFYYQKCPKSQK